MCVNQEITDQLKNINIAIEAMSFDDIMGVYRNMSASLLAYLTANGALSNWILPSTPLGTVIIVQFHLLHAFRTYILNFLVDRFRILALYNK